MLVSRAWGGGVMRSGGQSMYSGAGYVLEVMLVITTALLPPPGANFAKARVRQGSRAVF
jgi:hypothetical protein